MPPWELLPDGDQYKGHPWWLGWAVRFEEAELKAQAALAEQQQNR